LLSAFALGAVFGIALGPCTFAYMAPLLAMILTTAAARPWYGILLLVMYALGHTAVIVVAGTSAELVQRYLDWTERSKGAVVARKVCGALVLLGGSYLLYTSL
jgi:cytochrome c-type biogenesis protein